MVYCVKKEIFMKIWQLDFEVDKYDNLIPEKNFTLDEIRSFNGKKKKWKWKPLPVKRMEPEKNLELSDAPGFFTIPVFSDRALKVLRPIIKNSTEELKLICKEKKYYAINVTKVLDVVDYSKAEYIKFSDGNRIMVFEKYAFRICDELVQNYIFKIIDEPLRRAFVSEKFKNAVEENNLTGFKFRLVWDSEE